MSATLDGIERYRRKRQPENWLEAAMVERGAVLTADAVLVGNNEEGRTMTDNKSNEVRATTSTGKDDWCTPPAVLAALHAEFGFALDAAASAEALPGVLWFGWHEGEFIDGLEPWAGMADLLRSRDRGLVAFLNPPYSKAAGRGKGVYAWHQRALEASRNGWTVVVLCPPHPGRKWMQEFGTKADEVRVYKRRLAFADPATGKAVRGNTQDSCVVVYRPHVPADGWPGGPRWSGIDVPQ